MKTTVILRDDLYNMLVALYGPKGISKAINEFLAQCLFKKRKSMFGVDPELKPFVREEEHERFG